MKNNWPIKKLGEIAFVDWGNTSITKKSYLPKGFPAFSATGCDGFMESFEHDMDAVILSAIGARCGKTFFASGKWTAIKNTIIIYAKDEKVILNKFIFDYLDPAKWPVSGAGQPFITIGNAKKIEIPVPPLDIQKKIVERLDAIKKAQELNDLQISKTEELFKSVINTELLKPNPKTARICEVCDKQTTYNPAANPSEIFRYIDISSVDAENFSINIGDVKKIIGAEAPSRARKRVSAGDILFSTVRPNLKRIAELPEELDGSIASTGFTVVKPNGEKVVPKYLSFAVCSGIVTDQVMPRIRGANYPAVTDKDVFEAEIPLPPLTEQQKIVTKLTAIQEHKKLLLKQKGLLEELFDSVLYRSMNGELD